MDEDIDEALLICSFTYAGSCTQTNLGINNLVSDQNKINSTGTFTDPVREKEKQFLFLIVAFSD